MHAAYNSQLTKARVVVEQAFGILKARWRAIFIKAREMNVLSVLEIILCCTILHNICLSRGDVLDPEDVVDGVAGAAAEEDPGREGALPALRYTPDHDYV